MPRNVPSKEECPMTSINKIVCDLMIPEKKEEALDELCRNRDRYPVIAEILWFTPGIMVLLLQELLMVYPRLNTSSLTNEETTRACNVLALLQSIAVNEQTRDLFLQSSIALYLYPFLNTKQHSRSYEYLRLSSLGVIGGLVRVDSPKVIEFVISSEIVPLCLHIMEHGAELSVTVATFIVQKVLSDSNGFVYLTGGNIRINAVLFVLHKVVERLKEFHDSARLLKHILRCYLRLIDHPGTSVLVRANFPLALTQQFVCRIASVDAQVRKWLEKLLNEMEIPLPIGVHPLSTVRVPVAPLSSASTTAMHNQEYRDMGVYTLFPYHPGQ